MDSGTNEDLRGVWGSRSDVFAVGGEPGSDTGGTILHYDGVGWNAMSSGTSEDLKGVWGSSGSDVFAVGEYGTILHYSRLYSSYLPLVLKSPLGSSPGS